MRYTIYLKKNTKYVSKDDPNIRRRTEAQINNIHEMFNREIEDLKNKQLNNTVAEMKIHKKELIAELLSQKKK